MPTLKYTISDEEHAAYKAKATAAKMPVSVWMRSNLWELAKESLVEPAAKPVKLSAAEHKRLASFEDKLRSIANDLDCKGHVGQFLVMKMADQHLSAEVKAFYAEFMDWCLANGHVDEAALEEGQMLHEQRQAWHAEQREKMRSVKATRIFLPEK